MANDASTEIPGTIHLPVEIQGRRYLHKFLIMPSLRSTMIIGVDLWAKIGIILKPPPLTKQKRASSSSKISVMGLSTPTSEESQQLKEFLNTELQKFENIKGPTDRVQHQIRVKSVQPIKQRYRPRNPAMQDVINKEVEEMIKEGIIEPSRSAWSSQIVLVKKPNGQYRFCIDFRKVNEVTEKDAYPLPQVTATLVHSNYVEPAICPHST